jgi:hypothetical protein
MVDAALAARAVIVAMVVFVASFSVFYRWMTDPEARDD